METLKKIAYVYIMFAFHFSWFVITLPYILMRTIISLIVMLDNWNDKVWEDNDLNIN